MQGQRGTGLIRALALGLVAGVLFAGAARAQDMNLAPGFTVLPKGAKVAIMPADIELFSISAGGVAEPKADWTESAQRHFRAALRQKKATLGLEAVELAARDADDVDEVNALHAAIARSIALHHFGPGFLQLPTKDGRLDWSMGEAVGVIRQKSGADYALFSWIRDSYASAERVGAMIALAIFGVGVAGGQQVGYASLVDLRSGQVLWFNRLLRANGDLREAEPAAETLDALLDRFPLAR